MGYNHHYGAPVDAAAYGYGAVPVTPPMPGCGVAPVAGAGYAGRGFALIVVLFILLIIIGASWTKPVVK